MIPYASPRFASPWDDPPLQKKGAERGRVRAELQKSLADGEYHRVPSIIEQAREEGLEGCF